MAPPWRLRMVAIVPVIPLLLAVIVGFLISLDIRRDGVPVYSLWWPLTALLLAGAYTGFWLTAGRGRWTDFLAVATAVLAAVTVYLAGGPFGALVLWAYPAVVVGYAVRPALAPWLLGIVVVLGIAAVPVSIGRSSDRSFGSIVFVLVVIPLGGFLASVARELVQRNADLQAAREELAAVAVEEERARFSRDLHDLLGHTLSLMTVKVQLASRLLSSPEEARQELADVERLARTALEEIREVAGGYRQPTLASELAGARAALEAAGVTCELGGDAGLLPPPVEATMAWTVREGVTNVIRHSGARTCRIQLERRGGSVSATVSDDGRGGDGAAGRGLSGLRERVEALGGRIEHGATPAGFRVSATVPIGR